MSLFAKAINLCLRIQKTKSVQELYDAVNTTLSQKMKRLEQIVDELNVKIGGKDIFRFAVKKS